MNETTPATTRIIPEIPTASGQRRGWLKVVESVDPTKPGGYAFNGTFLSEKETDLPIGTMIIRCYPMGTVKNSFKEYDWGLVGEEKINWDKENYTPKKWLSFLDAIRATGKVEFLA